jgi:hypothetical protein
MIFKKRASVIKKSKAPEKQKTPEKAKTVEKPKKVFSIRRFLGGKSDKKAAPPAPKIETRQAEETKYYTGPVIQKFQDTRPFEFPQGYGDNRIVAMVRDPYWIYTYWEINHKRRNEIMAEIGEAEFNRSRECLRVYDVESWDYFDIEISGGARNWYVRIPSPNRTYCIDIGYKTTDGRFIAVARSNFVTTPRDQMSDVIDEQWMIPDWEKVYALSGGFGIGRGSEEIREMMKRRLQEESASGWVSSLSSPMRVSTGKERPFWLVANAELIVYGATEPTATVTLQGRKLKLREDGTFSVRFALPDGKQVIPIEAIRDDGAERRKITPIVERNTL